MTISRNKIAAKGRVADTQRGAIRGSGGVPPASEHEAWTPSCTARHTLETQDCAAVGDYGDFET